MAVDKQNLEDELHALGLDISSHKKTLGEAMQTLQRTRMENEELVAQNQRLSGAEEKLALVNQNVQLMEQKGTRLRTEISKMEKEAEQSRQRMSQLQASEKNAQKRVQTFEFQEQTLKQNLLQMGREEQAQQKRFEDLRRTHAAGLAESEKTISDLKASIDRHRHEIVQAEARLATLKSWEKDLDAKYQRLASLPEGSPSGLEVWRGVQELKQAVAEALPAKDIQARPETRIQVVPRAKPKP